MSMSSKKYKRYFEELREINRQIDEEASDELIQKKRDILFKIKQEVKKSR